jgi:HNH endonuclease
VFASDATNTLGFVAPTALPEDDIPPGICGCGCGGRTNIAAMTSKRCGVRAGEPYRYLRGHYKRTPKQDYVIDGEGCWIWQGALQRNGYGRTRMNGRIVMAHRAFYEMHRGPIPEGLVIDHLCRNRACVNPDHLEPVTRGENMRRGMGTKLTVDDARVIRSIVTELAERFGVSVRTIGNVAEGMSWKDA